MTPTLMSSQEHTSTKAELSALVKSITSSKTIEITSLAAKLKAEGRDIIAMSAGELSCPTIDSAKRAGIAAIEKNQTRYTINSGTLELRKAICNKYKRELNLDYSPDNVIVTAGAKQAILEVLMALTGPGDEVIVFAPYWVSYPEQINLAGSKMVLVETSAKNNFVPDIEALEAKITDKTKLVIVNSPSNPTGTVYPQIVLDRIAEVCADRGLWLMSDEIYEKIVFPPHQHYSPAQSRSADLSRVIIINGFSKTYAMTGWRLGYAIGPDFVIKAAGKIQSHTSSNACSISQAAALGAMQADVTGENDKFFETLIPELIEKRERALELLNATPGLSVARPDGAYYMMIDVSALFGKEARGKRLNDATDVCKWMIEDLNVALTPGEAFGAPEFLRLSFSIDIKLIEEACRRIQKGVQSLQ